MEQVTATSLRVYTPDRDIFNHLRGDTQQNKFLLSLLLSVDDEQLNDARLKSVTSSYEDLLVEAARQHDLVEEIAKYEGISPLLAADGGEIEETHE